MVLLSTGECGVVIHAWTDGETGATDCYVAFFGSEFPKSDEPTNATPHVLRYAATSLRREP